MVGARLTLYLYIIMPDAEKTKFSTGPRNKAAAFLRKLLGRARKGSEGFGLSTLEARGN